MKANQLFNKLGNKLLVKKSITPAAADVATAVQLASEEKALEIAFQVHDCLGVTQLHENWRN